MSRKPKKKGTGSLMQIFPILIVLSLIGSIFGPKKQEESTTRNNWSTSQTQTVPNNHTESQNTSNDHTGSQNTYNTRPDPEELQEQADSFLSENFQLDVVELQDKTLRYDITVTSAGISDREDQSKAPEDWDNFQLDFISAQARTSDELGISSTNTMLILVDSNNEVMLSARNGLIIENRYVVTPESQPEPPKNPSGGSGGNGDNFNTYDNPDQQKTGEDYVLNSGTMKFHYPSCSSVKKIAPENYSTYSGTRDEVIAKGYDPCGNCHP